MTIKTLTESKENYGIRSYLDQFYELPSPLGSEESWYLLGKKSQRRTARNVCRVIFIIGIIFLFLGGIGIILGYLWPGAAVDVKIMENGEPQDRIYLIDETVVEEAENRHDHMKILKIVGLFVFAIGGLITTITLLIPTCCRLWWESQGASEVDEEPVKIYPKISVDLQENLQSPTEKKVPVMEDIRSVQPQERRLGNIKEKEKEMFFDDEEDADRQ